MGLKKIGKFPDVKTAMAKFKRIIPSIIANAAKNHFLQGFRQGGKQTDESLSGWQPRKLKAKRNTGRAILVDTGQMRNDFDVRRTSFSEIILGTNDTIYATVHNEGGKAGRGAGFNMPKREYVGKSRKLDAKINTLMKRKLKEFFS